MAKYLNRNKTNRKRSPKIKSSRARSRAQRSPIVSSKAATRKRTSRAPQIKKTNKIKKISGTLRSKGVGSSTINSNGDTNIAALDVLEALGCTVLSSETYTIDFSLIPTQTDTETILNLNILDPTISLLKPNLINVGKNFKDFNDPLFTLDQPLSKAKNFAIKDIKAKNTTPNIESITADLIDLNINVRGGGTLKQFK